MEDNDENSIEESIKKNAFLSSKVNSPSKSCKNQSVNASDNSSTENHRTLTKLQQRKQVKSDEISWELVPPDGGWGWLVLAGSMLVNVLVPGTVKSFGVLFVEFLEAFEASPSAALWIPAICYFLYSSLGPLSSILSVKYSYRTVTLLGGSFAAFGMISSYFASSVTYLYISYGILVGTGAGLSFPPTVYIVTSYFVRFRGLANGICISGSAFGSIILPPILRFLLENYGYRGAILIMGGITLNTWVAGLFYEPVENHMKRVQKELPERLDLNDVIDEEDEGITLEFINNTDNKINPPVVEALKSHITTPDMPKQEKSKEFSRSVSAVVVHNYRTSNDESNHRQRKISTNNDTFIKQLNSTPSLYADRDSRLSHSSRLYRLNQSRTGSRIPKRSPSTSSFQYVSTPYHGSTLSFQPTEFTSHLSLKSIASSINPIGVCSKSQNKTRSKFIDLSLLRDPIYLIILLSNCTNAISYTNFIILLPTFATTLGFDKNRAAYLLSIVSVFDLIGRIGGSALSDLTTFIPKSWYFVGGLALSGFSLFVLPFATSYSMVGSWCGLFGLASGTYVGITAVLMADELGTERLTSSYGISLFVNGILQLVGPPICGIWFEKTKSYSTLFSTLGLALIAGASLWGFMPFVKYHRTKRELQDIETNENVI